MTDTHPLCTYIKVIRDEDLAEQIGKDICFDLVDYDKVRSFHVEKTISLNNFKNCVAVEFGIPARFQRFWIWAKRQNQTVRPLRPLTNIEEAQSVGEFSKVTKAYKSQLFLQVEHGLDLCPIAQLNERKDDDILLFFKLYDPEKEELRYVGRLFVNHTGKPSEILTKLNNLAGYDPDEDIELYEEVRSEPDIMCLTVARKLTFQENELQNGDIICFQKAPKMDNGKHFRYPDVASYFRYVRSCKVPFSSLHKGSKAKIATTPDESNSKGGTSKFGNIDLKEMEAMIDEDAIAAIDRVLLEGITVSLQSYHSIQASRKSLKVQELRDIIFKEDLFEKFKDGLTPKFNFNAVEEKINANANANAFSSRQLEQINAVVNLLKNIVRMFEKVENLKKEQDLAKKSTDQDIEILKEIRQKILTSKTFFTDQQTQLYSLDDQIADLKTKLEKLQGDRAKIAEIQDQEKDNMTSLNKEVKSIFHRLADDQIKLKSVQDKIQEALTDLESHEKLYQFFRAYPPF